MDKLGLIFTVVSRADTKKFLDFYKSHGFNTGLVTVGRGTAASDILDAFGLEESEKTVIINSSAMESWKKVKKELRTKLQIDVPGTGIAFFVPVSSVGGSKTLSLLSGTENFTPGEESSLKDTRYELIIIVANLGYTGLVMEAAHSGGAAGGTVIHAKGTGTERAEQFLGVSLASEKEMIMIVVKKEIKNAVMSAVMEKAGLSTKAKSIVFSLPVTDTAGLRLIEDIEEPSE